MNCSKTHSKLLDYLNGELDQKSITEVDEHLLGCPDCNRFLAELQQFHKLIEAEKKPAYNPFLTNRIMDAVKPEQTPVNQVGFRILPKLAKAAAVAILVVGGILSGLEIGKIITSGLSAGQSAHPEISSMVNELDHEPLEQMLSTFNSPAK